jgi:hypothetical protein
MKSLDLDQLTVTRRPGQNIGLINKDEVILRLKIRYRKFALPFQKQPGP